VLRRLCDLIARRQVDAVALAGPAATRNLLDRATRDGGAGEVLNAFIEDVAAICLGSTVDDQAIEMAVSRLRRARADRHEARLPAGGLSPRGRTCPDPRTRYGGRPST
jgi:uroporphyrinogen-III synthase